MTIQAQILDLIQELIRDSGAAVILVTHDLGVVAENCDTMAVIYGGRVAEYGPVDRLFKSPLHPYTRGLLNSLPSLNRVEERLTPILGTVPTLADLPPGCAFSTRCGQAREECRRNQPALKPVRSGNRFLACHLEA